MSSGSNSGSSYGNARFVERLDIRFGRSLDQIPRSPIASLISTMLASIRLWPKRNLHERRHIRLPVGRNHRIRPRLVLNSGGQADRRSYPEFRSHARIGLRSSLRNKLMADFQMPEAELKFAARGQPVGGPSLHALSLAAHPMAHQIAGIGETRNPCRVVIEKAGANVATDWRIGVDAFGAEIHLRELRQARKINASEPCCNVRPDDRTDRVVLGKAVGIKGQPITDPVTEIYAGASRPRLVGCARIRLVGRKYAAKKGVPRQRISGPAIVGGTR